MLRQERIYNQISVSGHERTTAPRRGMLAVYTAMEVLNC